MILFMIRDPLIVGMVGILASRSCACATRLLAALSSRSAARRFFPLFRKTYVCEWPLIHSYRKRACIFLILVRHDSMFCSATNNILSVSSSNVNWPRRVSIVFSRLSTASPPSRTPKVGMIGPVNQALYASSTLFCALVRFSSL